MTDLTGWTEEVWAIRTAIKGFYLCAEGGGGRELVANRPAVGPWEKFTVVHSPNFHRAAFRAANGHYVCAEGGGGGAVVANRPKIGPWEIFVLGAGEDAELDPLPTFPDGAGFYMQTANGHYVCAEGGGGGAVVANRREASDWEAFTAIKSFSAI